MHRTRWESGGRIRWAIPASGLLLIGQVTSLGAQDSSVSSDGAEGFLGHWSVVLEGPGGPTEIRFDLVEDGGQVVGEVSGGPGGRMISIEEVMWSGSDLLLGHRIDFAGERYQVMLTLRRSPSGLTVTLRTGGGGLTATGIAVRRPEGNGGSP